MSPFTKPWSYQPAADLDRSLLDRLQTLPREPDMLVYGVRVLAAVALRAALRIYNRFQISGLENLPKDGSFVLVANHSSHLDALCLLSALPLRKLHRTFTAAARDYFCVSLRRIALLSVFINIAPFARKVHLRKSLDMCRRLLAQPGNMLILFPEGTRSTSGAIGEFRRGIGSLVAGSKIPVIPCILQGAGGAWPKGSRFPRPRTVRLTIGKPRQYADLSTGSKSADFVARDLQHAVESLAWK